VKRDLPPGWSSDDPHSEVREEIAFYLEERTRELVAAGMPEAEARREAERRFGDVERIENEVRRVHRARARREAWRMRMGNLMQDVRLAVRGFAKRPGYSLVVVATIAVGIGAVTAIFTVVNATMLRALPFAEAEELVFLQGAFDAPEGPQIRGGSPPEVRDWARLSRSFEGVAPVSGHSATLTAPDTPAEPLVGEMVGAGYFDLLRVTPLRGRLFDEDEHATDAAPSVLIGERLWERRWARSEAALGTTLLLDDQPFTVVGVLPESFPGTTLEAEYWLPLVAVVGVDGMESRGGRWLSAVGRLAPGVAVASAQSDMDGVTTRLANEYPETNTDRIAVVTPVREVYLGETRTLFWILLGATGLLMAIAGTNVANLMLVRVNSTRGETLVRRALGASGSTVVRHSLVESAVLSAAGAGAGVLLGLGGIRLLADAAPPALLPTYATLQPDLTVFGVVVALTSGVALGVGLAPHLLTGRIDLATGLRGEVGRSVSGGGRVGALLVAGEVALALTLLVGAGLMTKSLRAQLGVDTGFDHGDLLAFSVQLPPETYPDEPTRLAALRDLEGRLAALDGVESVTWGPDAAPLYGGSSAAYIWTNESRATDDRIRFYYHEVAPGWFETVGARVVAGRPFEAADGDGWEAAVVSQAFATRHFGEADPVGRSLFIFDPATRPPLTVVGVVEDVRWRDLTTDLVAGPTDPDVWIPFVGDAGQVEFVVRTAVDPAELLQPVVETVAAFDPDAPAQGVAPISASLAELTAQGRFGSLLLGVFSALATFLAAVGLYGVLSYAVGRRTREIALRMALGADRVSVQRMVVLDGLKVAALGLCAGIVVALAASRSLEAFLYAVRPADIGTYVGVAIVMVAVATIAAWIPALRATRTEPQRALAGE